MKKILLLLLILFSATCFADDTSVKNIEYFDYDAFDEIDLDETELKEPAPIKAKIQKEQKDEPPKASETKSDTKFKFSQNADKSKDGYMTDEYKFSAGGEFKPLKFLDISSGLESTYRQYDQNSTKKLYFNPTVNLGKNISIDFLNKINLQNYTESHDVGLKLSPFKSKKVDFGIYTGISKTTEGAKTENVNFSMSIFF